MKRGLVGWLVGGGGEEAGGDGGAAEVIRELCGGSLGTFADQQFRG